MENFKVDNLFITKITNGLKMLLFMSKDQVGEGLKQAQDLHCRAHLGLGSSPPPRWVNPKIKRYELSTWTRLDMPIMRATTPTMGFFTW